jgi:hypothetical protein
MNWFSGVNDGNKISPRSANSRAVQVDRGEKTMVAKRMHAIRKAFEFILEIYEICSNLFAVAGASIRNLNSLF